MILLAFPPQAVPSPEGKDVNWEERVRSERMNDIMAAQHSKVVVYDCK